MQNLIMPRPRFKYPGTAIEGSKKFHTRHTGFVILFFDGTSVTKISRRGCGEGVISIPLRGFSRLGPALPYFLVAIHAKRAFF